MRMATIDAADAMSAAGRISTPVWTMSDTGCAAGCGAATGAGAGSFFGSGDGAIGTFSFVSGVGAGVSA